MKFVPLLMAAIFLTACGGRKMDAPRATDLIIDISQEALEKKDIEIIRVSQMSASEAIVETRLRTAFRLEKFRGKWFVREVHLGRGQWEKVSNLTQALTLVRIEETRKLLDQIAEAILKYREGTGSLPVFTDYVSLSDLLSPMYMTPLIRLDAWRQPLRAERLDANLILLLSAGPDGQFGTPDDVRRTVPP